ncbi:Glutathione transferase protein [Dioscorea alata]|uniref:Glutathione transferase protein n=1 Tax=Dioscorea alata TaxID=55571 RepID=A0ACB7WU41_DIOAL|nr:Glutathione transferase protein [Dioscorea alata]
MEGQVKVYYGKPMLPDVSRVLACLHEKDIQFKLVDIHEGHQMSPGFLNLQVSARAPVPGFEDGDTILFESRAICRYVAEKYAKQKNRYLLGRDLLERASIEQWLKSEELSFDPPSWTLVCNLAFAPFTNIGEQEKSLLLEQNENKLAKVLDVYDQRLSGSRFLAGNEFTLADLFHLPNSHYLANSEEWGHLFKSRKHVRRWWKKISNRPSWQKVVEILKQVNDASKEKQKAVEKSEIQTTTHKVPIIRINDLYQVSTNDQQATTLTLLKAEAPSTQSETIVIDQPAMAPSPQTQELVENQQEAQSNAKSHPQSDQGEVQQTPQPVQAITSTESQTSSKVDTFKPDQTPKSTEPESKPEQKDAKVSTEPASKPEQRDAKVQQTPQAAQAITPTKSQTSSKVDTFKSDQTPKSTQPASRPEQKDAKVSDEQPKKESNANDKTQSDQVKVQQTTQPAQSITRSESQTNNKLAAAKSDQTLKSFEPASKPEQKDAKVRDEQSNQGSPSTEKPVP